MRLVRRRIRHVQTDVSCISQGTHEPNTINHDGSKYVILTKSGDPQYVITRFRAEVFQRFFISLRVLSASLREDGMSSLASFCFVLVFFIYVCYVYGFL